MNGDRCTETLGKLRCEKADGHDGLHRAKGTIWGFRDMPVPEWRRRLRAKDFTGWTESEQRAAWGDR